MWWCLQDLDEDLDLDVTGCLYYLGPLIDHLRPRDVRRLLWPTVETAPPHADEPRHDYVQPASEVLGLGSRLQIASNGSNGEERVQLWGAHGEMMTSVVGKASGVEGGSAGREVKMGRKRRGTTFGAFGDRPAVGSGRRRGARRRGSQKDSGREGKQFGVEGLFAVAEGQLKRRRDIGDLGDQEKRVKKRG